MAHERDEIVIVGVCAAGKSTLAARLRSAGYQARAVAQEHSCIPDLWRWSGAPTTVYLHATYQAIKHRRTSLMTPGNYDAQIHRLRQARAGADVVVDTTHLTAEEVYCAVASHLNGQEESPTRLPVADEPGAEAETDRAQPLPVPDEPGEVSAGTRYDKLPIPDEL